MKRAFATSSGRMLRLGKELGRGGEGAAFLVDGEPGWVAKIYHDPIAVDKAAKLAAMARAYTTALGKMAAWPKEVVCENLTGRPVGLLSPFVAGEPVHMLYGPVNRKQHFPRADWAFLVRTGLNIAAAFETIQQAGCVIGDVNYNNVLVGQDATVRIIDCDSFQFRDGGRVYRCPVGVGHYTPPELQSVNFAEVDRTTNHDAFGYAIMLFQLLAMGRHPFAGRYGGAGDLSIERAISERRFAYGSRASSHQVGPPPHSIPFAAMGTLGPLFERAFYTDSRPSLADWIGALKAVEATIVSCSVNRAHKYNRLLAACPWCEIMRGGGPDFFITASLHLMPQGPTWGTFDLATVWKRIEAISEPLEFEVMQAPLHLHPMPLSGAAQRAKTMKKLAQPAAAVGVISLVCGLAAPPMFGIGAVLLVVAFVLSNREKPYVEEVSQRETALSAARLEHSQIANELEQLSARGQFEFRQLRAMLQAAANEHRNLRHQFDREMRELADKVVSQQLHDFLEHHFLDGADIPGIGAGRKAKLLSYGIETAADVSLPALQVIPGFGPNLCDKLTRWRDGIQRRFKPDKTKGVSDLDKRALSMRIDQKRIQLERQLSSGAEQLRLLGTETQRRIDARLPAYREAFDRFCKAQAMAAAT